MKTFNLPDLGEGLPEAEIVKWQVAEGDTVEADQPLVSVETAKAVVDVPSPYAGKIAKLHAQDGDIVETHKPLVDFDLGDGADAAEQAEPAQEAPAEEAPAKEAPEDAAREDSGTVVGQMQSSNEVLEENAIIRKKQRKKGTGRPKAAPAVRALARKEGVDLTTIEGTGSKGQITTDDVRQHLESGGAMASAPATDRTAPQPHKLPAGGIKEQLRGPRRAMAQSMARSRDEVVPCTLFDDADIHAWLPGQDITTRVLRSIVAGHHAEPGLNGFFDGAGMTRQIMANIDVAMAVDTPDGLIVPVVRDVGNQDAAGLRAQLNQIKEATRNRTVAPEDMRDPTIMLSNFGMMAGRYATPVIVPPTMSIIGTGGIRHDVVGVMGGIEVHKRIPLSITFDHRCITGGETCRFLAAMIQDLRKAQ